MCLDTPSISRLPAEIDVVVIGGGAAGLTVSRELGRRGIAHCVLEKCRIGHSWFSMPDALRLVSPWWTNALALRDVLRHWPFSKVSAQDYARYLEAYARRIRPPLVTGCNVLKLSSPTEDGGKFLISTSLGDFHARAVICATGYFLEPAPPDPAPQCDGSVPVIHASAFPGPEKVAQIARDRTVIVVGRRVSAGQLMVELADFGLDVAISVKKKVEFRRDGIASIVKDFLYYFYEECLIALRPRLEAPSFPVMDGGRSRRLVESGQVRVLAPIVLIKDGAAVLADGTVIRAGIVINATGYRPVISYLDSNCGVERAPDGLPECVDWESTTMPGLYFLGLDNRPNYRARTLRGIRRDCRRLARLVDWRLREGLLSPS